MAMQHVKSRWGEIGWRLAMLFCLMGLLGSQLLGQDVTAPLTAPLLQVQDLEIPQVVLKVAEERKIYSRVSGMIESSQIVEGTFISAGAPLLRLEARKIDLLNQKLLMDLQIARKQSESRVELEFGEKSVAVAQSEYDQAVNSNRRLPGVYSENEVNRLRLIVERARAELAKNEFNLEIARMLVEVKSLEHQLGEVEKADREVYAPLTGVITEVQKRPGEWVEQGELIGKMIRMEVLKAEIEVGDEWSVPKLAGAQASYIWVDRENVTHEFPGRVMWVDPQINPLTRKSRVWIEVPNQDQLLRPGMIGKVKLSVDGLK